MPKIDALPSGSSDQRDSLNHQAIEDYLKTIYMLCEEESPVSTSRIAEARDVKPASVTSMLQRLAKLNLVFYEKHRGVSLTETGEKLALEVIRHHRLLELYLMEALGFAWDEVHDQADVLEHVISEKLEERIADFLGHPIVDPHGDPIPTKDGTIISVDMQPLTSLKAGSTGTVGRIMDDANSDMLRYLAELGMIPGVRLEVVEVAPFDGPITVLVGTERRVIGHTVAESILIAEA
ncbi:MAG: metal-dependent transcriptional regulator [Anaerolineales bacterium]|nr:metal-dependent transcriptional regulator [Anaerolineales bacterium]MCB9004157.1 metal-dependent transcriptional regulator [Ardenticatenaceae bacterium]